MPRSLPFLAFLATAFAPSLARADDDGFTPLFNGKDLSGWVQPENKDLFTVEDGEIVGRTKGDLKKNEFLVTEKPYGDFILKAKIKLRNGNSGIQFRSKRADDGVVSGPQADVADSYWGLLFEERGREFLDDKGVAKAAPLVKKGDWNEYVIEVKGDHLVIHFNGTKILDRTDPEFAKTGIIALQVHVGDAMEVRFKDLMIKTLD